MMAPSEEENLKRFDVVRQPLSDGGVELAVAGELDLATAEGFEPLLMETIESTERSVTVVEWGAGVAEQLSEDWLHIAIGPGTTGLNSRLVSVVPHGARWATVGLRSALE